MGKSSAVFTLWRSLFLLALTLICQTLGYVRVCYYTNWSQYRPEPYRFFPSMLDPTLCTHVVFAFARVQSGTIVPTEWNDATLYRQLVGLKATNPQLKLLLAVGGWNHDNTHFTAVVQNDTTMNAFAQNAIPYMRNNGFDGLDLDWEYPAGRGGPAADRERFSAWTENLLANFEQEAAQTNRPRLLLTAAVHGYIDNANNFYELGRIGRSLDYILMMAYDFAGSWDSSTGLHSPIYLNSAGLAVGVSVDGFLNQNVPRDKLVLGIPFFGRSFTLSTSNLNLPNSGLAYPATGAAAAGAYTGTRGFLAYYEICANIIAGWTSIYDSVSRNNIAYGLVNGNINWVGYDGIQTIREKSAFIRNLGLAGAMVWSIELDDFRNNCNEGVYPLATTLKTELPDDTAETTPGPTTLPSTAVPATTRPTTTPSTAVPTTPGTTTPPSTAVPTTPRPTTLPSTAVPTTPRPTTPPSTAVPTSPRPTTPPPTAVPTTPRPTTPPSTASMVSTQRPVTDTPVRTATCQGAWVPSVDALTKDKPHVHLVSQVKYYSFYIVYYCACEMGYLYNPCEEVCDTLETRVNPCVQL